MTPYQRAAFAYPCTVQADLNRPNGGSVAQLAQMGPGAVVAPVSHHERGFRVTMIVDAVPESAGVAEGWPTWHISVALHGALSAPTRAQKGKAHEERPLGNWGALREREALHIIRRELRGVGDPATTVVVNKAQSIAMFEQMARQANAAGKPGTIQMPVAVFGRRRLTPEEADLCFTGHREILARLNPTYVNLAEEA